MPWCTRLTSTTEAASRHAIPCSFSKLYSTPFCGVASSCCSKWPDVGYNFKKSRFQVKLSFPCRFHVHPLVEVVRVFSSPRPEVRSWEQLQNVEGGLYAFLSMHKRKAEAMKPEPRRATDRQTCIAPNLRGGRGLALMENIPKVEPDGRQGQQVERVAAPCPGSLAIPAGCYDDMLVKVPQQERIHLGT